MSDNDPPILSDEQAASAALEAVEDTRKGVRRAAVYALLADRAARIGREAADTALLRQINDGVTVDDGWEHPDRCPVCLATRGWDDPGLTWHQPGCALRARIGGAP